MIQIINLVVGIILFIFLLMGILCNLIVRAKYNKMFQTMRNRGHDKNLLIIERDYRHGYLKDRVERIKVFVENEYYQIKIGKIPLYAYEDFTVNVVYFIALLGLTFTLIVIAIPNINFQSDMKDVFFLSIEGLLFGIILMLIRIMFGVSELREIFKVKLCSYLEHELELFDEAERDENLQNDKKIQKENYHDQEDERPSQQNGELVNNCVDDISDVGESKQDNTGVMFDEDAFIQVLDEIFG